MSTRKERTEKRDRTPVTHFYDVRLIKEIVQAVEDGTPRLVLLRQYGFSECTLSRWMNKYGSAAYQQNRPRVYKASQKRSVLRAITSGMSISEARISFGISSSSTIRNWIREESDKNCDLSLINSDAMTRQVKQKDSDEVKVLKAALAYAELKNKALNTLIDVAEEQFKIDIRKKPGARQSQK